MEKEAEFAEAMANDANALASVYQNLDDDLLESRNESDINRRVSVVLSKYVAGGMDRKLTAPGVLRFNTSRISNKQSPNIPGRRSGNFQMNRKNMGNVKLGGGLDESLGQTTYSNVNN
jgi:hypothetical protein